MDNNLAYGKKSPQSTELESAVLGAIMLEPDCLQTVTQVIKTPEHFYSDANQRIYGAILRMYNRGSGIDFMTVSEELQKKSELEIVGGSYYVTTLTTNVVSSARILQHAQIIVEKYLLREIIKLSGRSITDAYEDGADPFELLNKISSNLLDLESVKNGNGMIHAKEAAAEAIEEMEIRAELKTDLIGESWGFKELDQLTGGASSPQLTILAADTGVGKSTWALNVAQHMAFENVPTAYFSLEMSPKQLIYKSFAGELNKPIKNIRLGKITEDEKSQLGRFMSVLGTKNLYFNSRSGMDVIEMRSVIRGLAKTQGVKKVFVDYLQLVSGGAKKFGTREAEMAYVSKQLKECCLELDINIIALSQVTVEKGFARLYVERDLRESSAIGQNADNIFFIIRPVRQRMNGFEVDGNSQFEDKDAFIQIAKCREGELGLVPLDFFGVAQKFKDKEDLLAPPQKNNFKPLEKLNDNNFDNPF